MNIHCFYSDIILSLQHLFDTKVFPGGIIKGYQFNIGNRSLQLKYETGFEFPRIIINYQSSKPMNYHPYTWTRTQLNNAKIPVLYGKRRKLTLLLHEELFEFQIQVSINCESQFQALQLEHILQNYMVMNKYFHMYKFFSFLEIERQFLHEDIFDVENDDIVNLFSRYDSLTNSTNYCFSVEYEPLIRMDSCDLQLTSTDQRSFQLQLGISMINPMPVFLEIPPSERGKDIAKKAILEEDVIVPTGHITVLKINIKDGKKIFVIPVIVNSIGIEYEFSEEFRYEDDNVIYSGTVVGTIIGRRESGVCKVIIDEQEFDSNCTVDFDYQDDTIIANFSGAVNGQVSNFAGRIVKVENDNIGEIDGNFAGILDNKFVNTKLHATYDIETSVEKIINGKIDFDNETTGSITSKYLTSIPIGTIDDCTNLTTRLLKITPEGTRIKEVVILYNDQIHNYVFQKKIFCDQAGNFQFPLIFHDQISNEAIEGSVIGKVNSITRRISYRINSEKDFKIILFKCDFRFNSSVGYGASFIERINIDFADTFQPIMTESFIAESRKLSSTDNLNRTFLRTAILQFDNRNDIFTISDDGNSFTITVILDEFFNYDEILIDNKVYWKFFVIQNNISPVKQPFYDSNTKDIQLKERNDLSKPNILEFICTRDVYDDYFSSFNEINPILFQVAIH
jgi:hypothetical protein